MGFEVVGEGWLTFTVVLEPGEQRELQSSIEAAAPMESRTFAPFEIVQSADERPVGGIAVALIG
jgi:hypothetical protein